MHIDNYVDSEMSQVAHFILVVNPDALYVGICGS